MRKSGGFFTLGPRGELALRYLIAPLGPLFLLMLGCVTPEVLLREGKAPIIIPGNVLFTKTCGSGKDGCADCDNELVYINRTIKKGSVRFLTVLEHEDAHIDMGCTDLDHCKMDRAIVGPEDFCEGWRDFVGVKE